MFLKWVEPSDQRPLSDSTVLVIPGLLRFDAGLMTQLARLRYMKLRWIRSTLGAIFGLAEA